MSNPRVKRPFAGAASDPSQRQITTFFTSTRPTTATTQKPAQQPTLPSVIQSDLLSVGMRVRKSVPEGYKTGSPHSAFRLWDERGGAVRVRRGGAGAGELVPFCGVHRVGGYSVQPARADDIEDEEDELLEMPGLTSSQDTVESVEFENSKKRSYEEEEEGLEVLGASVMAGNGGNRVIAVPKGRRKGGAGAGQENVAVNDFEEADFLDERVFGDFTMSDV